jgi:hypothetical protein
MVSCSSDSGTASKAKIVTDGDVAPPLTEKTLDISKTPFSVPGGVGNSNSNYASESSGAFAAGTGGRAVFASYDSGSGLLVASDRQGNLNVIAEGMINHVSAVGDDLFYCEDLSYKDMAALVRQSADGGEKEILLTASPFIAAMIVADRSIIYSTFDAGAKMWRYDPETGETHKITEAGGWFDTLNYDDGYIYYPQFTESDDSFTLARIRPDGTDQTAVVPAELTGTAEPTGTAGQDAGISGFIVDDGILYFTNFPERTLYRVNLPDGSAEKILDAQFITAFVLADDRIIYLQPDFIADDKKSNNGDIFEAKSYYLFSEKIGGGDKVTLADDIKDAYAELNIAGDHIYCRERKGTKSKVWRMPVSGGDRESLNS